MSRLSERNDYVQSEIDGAVNAIIKESSAKALSDAAKAKKDGRRKAQTGAKGSVDQDLVTDIVRQVMTDIVPVIGGMVAEAIKASTRAIVNELQQNSSPVGMGKMKTAVQTVSFDIDRLEQYSRRESVRISGLKESEGEDTDRIVCDLVSDLGIKVSPEDISVSHRLGRPNFGGTGRHRSIICKFVRRNIKTQVMKTKKKLRDMPMYNGVFIDEDLTPLRAKISRELRSEAGRRAWTIDGKIHTAITKDGKESKVIIDSPDDLMLKVGWSEEKVKSLGIYLDL
jgi:hypothetical protein